ncbi:MAG: hypothetical protein HYT20_02605 [Candidatus Nealsonbacteria bacterium]|nr:hypothetical protein [Candidatus Nealsonbacteria bacterium]
MNATNGEMEKILRDDLEKLKAPEGYFRAGLPKYNTLYGRDALIVGWQMLTIDPQIAKNTLKILAKLQGKKSKIKNEEEPGKIIHEYVKFWSREGLTPKHLLSKLFLGYPYYGSADSTPLFIILAAFYFEKTGDADFLKEIWPNIEAAVNWLRYFGDKDGDGFIEYKRKNPFGLYHQAWKDTPYLFPRQPPHKISSPVAAVEIQGYAYLAYKKIAGLSKEIFGKPRKELEQLAENLKRNFDEKFWMGDFFAFCLDGEKRPHKIYASNPGHLLFTGIIEKSRIPPFIERLTQEDLWSPYGIRTLSSEDPSFKPDFRVQGPVFSHDNWIIIQGLKKAGYFTEAEELSSNLIKAFQCMGFMPECFGVKKTGEIIPEKMACCPQAWSSAALLDLIINNK